MHVPILLLCVVTLEARKSRVKSTSPLPRDLDKIPEQNDETFERPVDFLHVYREGFGDKDYKQPINLLDLDMIKPRNKEHAQELLQKTKKQNIEWIPKDKELIFNNPRDELLYYKKMQGPSKNNSTSDDKSHIYDFLGLLEKNLAYPVFDKKTKSEVASHPGESLDFPRRNSSDEFMQNSFNLRTNQNHKINWTTCDEFSKKALFHSHDIVNTKWLPFFIWSKRGFSTAQLHVFSHPTKKRVTYYKTSFGPYVKDVDWSQPKLLLKERREILLISSNRHGFFYGIPDQEAPTPVQGNVILPTILLRIKTLSSYLAMMYCDDFYSIIMAEEGTGPRTNSDKIREASTLGFRGIGVPVDQDLETERLLARVTNLRRLETEDRKVLKIRKKIGDVDRAVRH